MTPNVLTELIEAARPFAEGTPSEDWPCHAGAVPMERCPRCQRILRLQRAIQRAEAER